MTHEQQHSEYFAPPAALLALKPDLNYLRELKELTLNEELNSEEVKVEMNLIDIPDPASLVKQYAAAMTTIDEHVPIVFVGDVLADTLHEAAYDELVSTNVINAMFARDSTGAAAPWTGQIAMAKMGLAGRTGEPAVVKQALLQMGAEVIDLEGLTDKDTLEGGDVIPVCLDGKNTLLVGISDRTTVGAAKALFEQYDGLDQLIMVAHPSEILHLDTGMTLYSGPEPDALAAVVAEGMFQGAVLLDKHNPKAGTEIDMGSFLQNHGFQLIEISAKAAIDDEACNVLALSGGKYIGFSATDPELIKQIESLTGAEILLTPGDEIAKATGGLHCLTHQLFGKAVLNYVTKEKL